jgi:hypothetical protein
MELNAHGVDEADVRTATASVTAARAWLRFLIPSTRDLVFVLLLLGLAWGTLAQGLLRDAGIGWHICTGQLILGTHSIPHTDPFSSTMQGKPWYAWEWLFDAVVGIAHHLAGLNGVVFFSALVIALTFALLLRRMLARGTNLPVAILVLLLAVAASSVHLFARPHVLSWLFTIVWWEILERFEDDGQTVNLLWLPILTLLWVNVHGGFLVGFVLLAIYFASAMMQRIATVDDEGGGLAQRVKALALAGVLSFAASFANPYGYRLHIHIYRYLTDRFLMDHIDEFLSPNFHGMGQKCFAVLVLLALIAAAMAHRKVGLSHLLVMLFAIYAGLYAARNIPVSAILLGLTVAPLVSAWLSGIAGNRDLAGGVRWLAGRIDSFGIRMAALDSNLRGHLWPAATVVLGLWVCGHGGRLAGARVMDAHFDGARFPVGAVDFLQRNGTREPVFCPDRWGGYLIYRLYPQAQVAVDDRHDFYGTEFLKRYLKIVHGEPGWESELEGMHVGWVMVPAQSTLASLLEETHRWDVAHRDDTAVVFRSSRGSPP